MARWIDADLIENIDLIPYKRGSENINAIIANVAIVGAKQVVDKIPTADVAPVIHAHWIEDCGDYKCSHCSTEFWDEIVFIVRTSEYELPNYCPVCGAKMEEGVLE